MFSDLLGRLLPASWIPTSILVSKGKSWRARALQTSSTRGCNRPTPGQRQLPHQNSWALDIGPSSVAHTDLVGQRYAPSLCFSSSLFQTQEEVERLLKSGALGLKSWLCHFAETLANEFASSAIVLTMGNFFPKLGNHRNIDSLCKKDLQD